MKLEKLVLLGIMLTDVTALKAEEVQSVDLKEAIVQKEIQDSILTQLVNKNLVLPLGDQKSYLLNKGELFKKLIENGVEQDEALDISHGVEDALEELKNQTEQKSLTEMLDEMGVLKEFNAEAKSGTICV